MEAPQRLALLAQQQHGLVSLRQAVALGLPARTMQDRVQRQGWVRVHRGVYALPGSVRSYERDVAGALLAAGPSAVACRGTATFLVGLSSSQTRPIELMVPAARRARLLPGVVVHRSSTLCTVDVVRRGSLPTTSIPRTLCDLAPSPERHLRELTARALQQRATTISRIAACSERLGLHPGVATLRRVLEQLKGTSSDSGWERDVRDWLRREGLAPDPRVFPVRAEDDVVCELDIAYPDEMVYVDCLGFPWHSLPMALETDAVRGNGIVAAGWLGLTLTQEQFDQRSARFLRQLRSLLDQRAGFAQRWLPSPLAPARPPVPPRTW